MSHPLTDALPDYLDALALRQACGEIEEKLTRERNEARNLVINLRLDADLAADERDALRVEVEALRNAAEELVRDARRYRDLMAAARQAVLALAHASEYNPRYIRDYQRLSDAIDAAIAQEQPNSSATLTGSDEGKGE
jgi:hypothetical protein